MVNSVGGVFRYGGSDQFSLDSAGYSVPGESAISTARAEGDMPLVENMLAESICGDPMGDNGRVFEASEACDDNLLRRLASRQ